MGVEEPPFIPVSKRNPADARDDRLAHDLPGPFSAGQVLAVSHRLDEKLRHAGQEQRVVHRAIGTIGTALRGGPAPHPPRPTQGHVAPG
jgi:hypothetical protein